MCRSSKGIKSVCPGWELKSRCPEWELKSGCLGSFHLTKFRGYYWRKGSKDENDFRALSMKAWENGSLEIIRRRKEFMRWEMQYFSSVNLNINCKTNSPMITLTTPSEWSFCTMLCIHAVYRNICSNRRVLPGSQTVIDTLNFTMQEWIGNERHYMIYEVLHAHEIVAPTIFHFYPHKQWTWAWAQIQKELMEAKTRRVLCSSRGWRWPCRGHIDVEYSIAHTNFLHSVLWSRSLPVKRTWLY